MHSRWPGWAVDRAAWIHQQLETGYTLVEIAEQVKAGQAPAAVDAAAPEVSDEASE